MDEIGSDAQTVWNGAADDNQKFWSDTMSLVTAKKYSNQNVMDLLNAFRANCDKAYAGRYTLPDIEGLTFAQSPMQIFASLAASSYDAGVMLNAVTAVLGSAAEMNMVAPPGNLYRRDAAIDVARVALAWYGGLTLFPSPIPAVSSSDDPVMGYVEQGLNICGVLVLAVPTVGPLMSGALQAMSAVLSIFFPGPNATDQAYAALSQQIAASFEQAAVTSAANGLYADGGWLGELYDLMAAPETADLQPAELKCWLIKNVQTQLAGKLAGNTTTLPNLLTLKNWVNAPGVIELFAYGISVYLGLCRQMLVTDLTLAQIAQARNADIDLCLQDIASAIVAFTQFKHAIIGDPDPPQSTISNWSAQLNAMLFQVAAGRLAQIPAPSKAGSEFAAWDKGTPKGKPPTGLGVLGKNSPKVMQAFSEYVISVAAALDALYAPHFACINSWNQSLADWSQKLPVFGPVAAPSIASWTLTAPQGTVWVKGAQIRYAYSYANSTGTSPNGPWSQPVTVDAQACPVLQLQPDPSGSGTAYWIFRQVCPPGASAFNGTIAIGSPDSSQTEFTDTDTTTLGPSPT
jgi:hypothetical protein